MSRWSSIAFSASRQPASKTEDIAPHLLRQPKVLQLTRARFQSIGHVRRAVRRAKCRQTDRPVFVELSGDQCIKPCRRMRERLALKCFARVIPRPLTQPARRRITGGVTESVLDKLSGDHEIAPVIAYAAEDDVRVRVVGVEVVDGEPFEPGAERGFSAIHDLARIGA